MVANGRLGHFKIVYKLKNFYFIIEEVKLCCPVNISSYFNSSPRQANLRGTVYDDTTTFPFWFSRSGKGLLKDVPCSVGVGEAPDNLSLWERYLGIENRPVDSYGERECAQKESSISINNGQRKGTKEVEKDNKSSNTPTTVLQ